MKIFRWLPLLLIVPAITFAQFGRVDVDTSQLTFPVVVEWETNLDLKDFPGAITQRVSDMRAQSPALQSGYEVRTRDNLSLYIKRDGKNIQQVILLIKGDSTPKFIRGIWDKFQGSKLKNTIVYNVTPGHSQKSVLATQFPGALQEVVKNTYGGSIDLQSGQHAYAQLAINGPMKEVLRFNNYPTDNLIAHFGREVPEISWETGANAGIEKSKNGGKGDPTKALEATNYIEIFRQGVWPNAMGLTGLTITDATLYYDSGNVFGWWGVGEFEGDPLLSFYQGPLLKSKDPRDYLGAQIGFGAKNMTLPKYLKLTALYNSRFPGQSYAFAGPTDEVKTKSLDVVFKGLDTLPLDLIRLTQKKLNNFSFKSGDPFPGPDKFNFAILGPLATGKDGTKGPLISAIGTAQFLNQDFSNLDLKINPSRATLATDGRIDLSLGSVSGQSLGSIGGAVDVTAEVSTATQNMNLHGSIEAGPLGGRGVNIALKQDQFDFSNPALCTFPFEINAVANVSNLESLSPSDLLFTPQATLPDPTALLSCPEDIYFLMKNGVAIAMNGTVKLAEFAESFLPENDVTRIGIEGLKFANGAILEAPEEMLNLARQVPGVGELEDLNNLAKDQAKKAAEAAAKEAARAATEAARVAEKAVNETINQVNNFARDPGGTIKSIGGAVTSVGNAIGGLFGGGGSSLPGFGWKGPYLPIKAIDVGAAHKSHSQKLQTWFISETGYPLELDDLGGARFYFYYRNNGLPGNFPGFIRIDSDKDGYAAAIDKKGRLWTYNGRWQMTNTYATDLGIGGSYIWITSTEPQWGSYKIYRAPYAVGRTQFNWQYMHGAGTKIDVGADGRAWAINKSYEVWEYNGGWHNRDGKGLDITVSNSNRAWIIGLNYSHNEGGGLIYTYERCHRVPFTGQCAPGNTAHWAPTAGRGLTIGAGYGRFVWTMNSHKNVFFGTGRE